jgi:membrane fusion protein, multidrug efflux system
MNLDIRERTIARAPIAALSQDLGTNAAAEVPSLQFAPGLQQQTTAKRLLLPVSVVIAVLGFAVLTVLRWDVWANGATFQSTDDAYVGADMTRLSSRVAGQVLSVAVNDFQRVKKYDLLVQIDPADYQAEVDRASAVVVGAAAALDNLANQIELQRATIAQAEAALQSSQANQLETRQEFERQQALSRTEAGTRQKLEQATAGYARADANVQAGHAAVAAQHHQLEVLRGTVKQRAAELDAARAALAAANLRLGYTKIVAPFDGVTSARRVQAGDYVNIGTNLINVVPLPKVYVMANYKETQLTYVKPGQAVAITVDSFATEALRGRVERISPASGSQFALLPPDNATGNFTKVVQRVPVRIALDEGQPLLERLLPGMSVITRIQTSDASNR